MGFNHNNQQYADETSYQFVYKHPRQMNCGGQMASFPDFSPCCGITANYPCPEGDREGILSQFRGKVRCGGDNVLNGGTPTRDAHVGSSLFTRSSSEAAGPLHSKRPFSEDTLDSCQEAIKRVRQVGQTCEDSYVHLASSSGTSDMQPTSDVVGETEIRSSAGVSVDPTKRFPSGISNFPWLTSEDTRPGSPVRLSFFPGYFEDGRRTAALKRTEEANLLVFHYPPQKIVPLGPNHQAEVPIMRSRHFKISCSQPDDSRFSHKSSTFSDSAGHLLVQEDDSDKWMGTCIMSMPDSNPLALEDSIRKTRTECGCCDDGSIRCVRQHVNDAREKLKNRLGKRFLELGFCDMGEVVAQKWTEEDGQLFHEVVASNPVSLGKNFWDVLSLAFPSRSSKELVSYYFNVFMLRKRAEQNRAAPLNVDSDDDEWQGSDDGQFEMTDEDDEDSAVESLADRDDATCNNSHMYDEAEDEDVSFDSAFAGDDDAGLHCVSKFTPKVQPMNYSSQDGAEDQNVQDESCTSFEEQAEQHSTDYPSGGPAVFVETNNNQVYRNDSLSGLTDYVYHGAYCEPNSWDISYLPGTEKDVDFLPTCNVIEEFGKDSWGI